jgi:methylmalonyl-CoA mutase cobalamin-binding subunit
MSEPAALPDRAALVPPNLRPGGDLLAEGRAMARDWRVARTPFLDAAGVSCEADYKRAAAAGGRIMQHAHIGFRSVERTVAAIAEVHATCHDRGVSVDRFGITLDWSMGYPAEGRRGRRKGTGIVLDGPEDFARITGAAPAAAHFGDFMLGLPGALDNTKHALAAGATAIGNLGQYFTFRLPDWDDDVVTTEATVQALGLIAAQDVEVLVHSNLDDGFAGLFADMSATLGMVLIEKHIVETLIGARASHCFGHHFTAPVMRLAFHRALAVVTDGPGTMIYGNTVSYRSTAGGNFASLASYLQADIWALRRRHTGHAINPVPVSENERIPDTDEIIEAQIFAARLVEHASDSLMLVDFAKADAVADRLVEGGVRFAAHVLGGLADAGIDTADPAELMIALRRVGPKRLEALYGPGTPDRLAWGGRAPVIAAEWVGDLETAARDWVARTPDAVRKRLCGSGLKVCVGSSDVHEHGKTLVEQIVKGLGLAVVDGGTSVDPEALVGQALRGGADILAISTYNGIALRYAREVCDALARVGTVLPVCIGGRLNQVPDDSNTGLPVDVSREVEALGVTACTTPERLIALLDGLARPATPSIPSFT